MLLTKIPQRQIKVQYQVLKILEDKCNSCILFRAKKPDNTFVYTVFSEAESECNPALVAISKYENVYALYSPSYLTEKDLEFLHIIFSDIQKNELVVVFSEICYTVLKKHCFGKSINVQLYI